MQASSLHTLWDLKLRILEALDVHPRNAAVHAWRSGSWQALGPDEATLAGVATSLVNLCSSECETSRVRASAASRAPSDSVSSPIHSQDASTLCVWLDTLQCLVQGCNGDAFLIFLCKAPLDEQGINACTD